jgi:hypothetical protein
MHIIAMCRALIAHDKCSTHRTGEDSGEVSTQDAPARDAPKNSESLENSDGLTLLVAMPCSTHMHFKDILDQDVSCVQASSQVQP